MLNVSGIQFIIICMECLLAYCSVGKLDNMLFCVTCSALSAIKKCLSMQITFIYNGRANYDFDL